MDVMERKHAYLIIAHSDFYILKKLISLLDDKRNDIYIHMDSKVENFNEKEYFKLCKHSSLYFIDRIDCRWGNYSLVQCELNLLKEAVQKKYLYYHLLSGVDLPLKSQDEIHKFFDHNMGSQFVHFCNEEDTAYAKEKVKYYYFLTKHLKCNNKFVLYTQKIINKVGYIIQKSININRFKNYKIGFGSQWFSITDDLARYIVENEKWIYIKFIKTRCPDEIFLQTIIKNSDLKLKLFNEEFIDDYFSCLRYIDWKRGNPYIWKDEDFDELINSKYLFARKFSSDEDKRVIDKIFKFIKSK